MAELVATIAWRNGPSRERVEAFGRKLSVELKPRPLPLDSFAKLRAAAAGWTNHGQGRTKTAKSLS